MRARFSICLLAASLSLLNAVPRAASTRDDSAKDDAGEWSREVNGLPLHLKLVEKGKLYGTRRLVPYLKLRNVEVVWKWAR
jgi:hypothetical protein